MSKDSFYPPSRPRAVEGGIRARSARGAIARTWWGARFIEVLDSVVVGGRMQRGRTYARKGQVVSLEVDAGTVSAVVQGSRARPYRVRVGATTFGKAQWAQVERALADDAWYLARLLAGEMPEDIEEVFAGVGLSLFPSSADDLSMDCSCPDWSVPCKHLAATLYLLAESFDEDPFRILAWRGRTREDLLDNIGAAAGGPPAADAREETDVPLEERLDTFYQLQGELPASAPAAVASLLGQVPQVAVRVRGRPLVELLGPAYRQR
ncbi:SWIM zinc finger family protein [Ornithinimicrobium avium]|uniref:SWIM-type domain-containing protein n=1 Tax=Ornithinimicrobium avium TaxID=2283195 RepID=A0A345NKH4_9MICO|nr:SWIM zinc finger family protein [Ornithinimicrobium avium]AXH95532.1 hypothetical protein DV701_04770 [Ornithinimicrobium avium]